ncbi:type VI secretion system ImpA family N-terminal domain-containing protein [Enterovibrio coralii]|uniref:type VI secretion system ImpA family N-terminal domain-containing protein n=1 Tax=Enterovibrio coralii TaxID=294935 RepID=UPI001E2A680C|nr:type VI secretion system ImpA family N-terminal domain-containing protein [Enterovibrio coralii]
MFTDINGAKKAGNSARLRDASEYQKIRSEINRRFNPLAGSTDWDKVRELCEQLAEREGVDLLVAIYYTVAAMKTQGLSAFADGLELQVTVLRTPNDDDMPFAKQADLYRWMLGRIGEEVRAMRPSLEQLRDLYRCERALESIDRYLSLNDEGKVEDLDVLGYAIFEHIDRIERSAKAQPLVNHVEVVEERQKQNSGALVFAIGLLVGGLGYYGLTLVQGEIETPITILTEPEKIPKIVSADEASSIHATFSAVQLRESQLELASSYSDQVSILLASKVGDNYASG